MNNDLLNILSNSNKDIDNQKLMDYLAGKLSEQEKHEVEMWMVDNDFENEALDGLQQMAGSNKKLEGYVDQLNKELHQYIIQKKNRREKRRINNPFWIYVAIVFILVIIILAYMVISKASSLAH